MSSAPFEDDRASSAEVAAGFLAAISLTASAIALVYRPVRLAPFALLIAFIAVALAKTPQQEARRGRGCRGDRGVARRHGDSSHLEQSHLLGRCRPAPEGIGVVERT